MNISEELGDLPTRVVCLNNIGLILELLGDYSKTLESFSEAHLLAKAYEDKLGIAIQLENIGRNLKNEKKFGEALKYFKQSLYLLSQVDLENPFLYMREKIKSQIREIRKYLNL